MTNEIRKTGIIDVIGIGFVQFASKKSTDFDDLFTKMGFIDVTDTCYTDDDDRCFQQGAIRFLVSAKDKFASDFYEKHGPSVPAYGFTVRDAYYASAKAKNKFATDVSPDSYHFAMQGVGGSKIFLLDKPNYDTNEHQGVGLKYIDHMTNNVESGQMDRWAQFYSYFFGFRQLKYFDIDGKQTGLTSRAMGNDCIAIPINEDKSDKGQIAEFLKEYNGAGIQHIALLTDDIYTSVEQLRKNGIEFLDVPDTYYEMLDERIPEHGEDLERMKENQILVDGEKGSILLQIFTKTCIGPVFFEIIQRKNNKLFGDGNFKALFESIELDQIRRGVL